MAAIKFRKDDLFSALGEAKPVPAPVGTPVSQVRSTSLTSQSTPTTRCGVWECSPGRWRRQIVQAEFCHFLEGSCVFEPDDGEPIQISGGDVIYFPKNSAGVWNIIEASRKIFVLFDERADS